MINFNQLEELTRQTLADWSELDTRLGRMADRQRAVTLIMMIIAHESNGGTYLKQVRGPALGIIQMEPLTHDDVWNRLTGIEESAAFLGLYRSQQELISNLRYNIFMARAFIMLDREPLPDYEDASAYLKRYYNTHLGAAKPDSYVKDYERWKRNS